MRRIERQKQLSDITKFYSSTKAIFHNQSFNVFFSAEHCPTTDNSHCKLKQAFVKLGALSVRIWRTRQIKMFLVELFVQFIPKQNLPWWWTWSRSYYHGLISTCSATLKIHYKGHRLVTGFQTWESWAIVQQLGILKK